MDFAMGILGSDAVVSALAVLVALLLASLTELVRRQLRRVGIEVDQKQQEWLRERTEEAILFARQAHREMVDGPERNERMHQSALGHIKDTGGRVVKKLGRQQLDIAIQAGVRRLKKLL